MDLCSAVNNLEPDLSLTSFPSSVLMCWQTLGEGRLHLLQHQEQLCMSICIKEQQGTAVLIWDPSVLGALSLIVPAGG